MPTPTPMAVLLEGLGSSAGDLVALAGVVVAGVVVAVLNPGVVIVGDVDLADEDDEVCVCVKLSPMMVRV